MTGVVGLQVIGELCLRGYLDALRFLEEKGESSWRLLPSSRRGLGNLVALCSVPCCPVSSCVVLLPSPRSPKIKKPPAHLQTCAEALELGPSAPTLLFFLLSPWEPLADAG